MIDRAIPMDLNGQPPPPPKELPKADDVPPQGPQLPKSVLWIGPSAPIFSPDPVPGLWSRFFGWLWFGWRWQHVAVVAVPQQPAKE